MNPHHETGTEKNAGPQKAGDEHGDDAADHSAEKSRARNSQELPDGSGTDAQGSGGDQGQEGGGETFDAG